MRGWGGGVRVRGWERRSDGGGDGGGGVMDEGMGRRSEG